MNWNESRIRCQAQGADLISWFDESEYMPLYYWLKETCVNPDDGMCHSWWTSGNDFMFPGDWMWGEGPEYVPFQYWADGEPNGGSDCPSGDCHCAEMYSRGELDDFGCYNGLAPLCQIRK